MLRSTTTTCDASRSRKSPCLRGKDIGSTGGKGPYARKYLRRGSARQYCMAGVMKAFGGTVFVFRTVYDNTKYQDRLLYVII